MSININANNGTIDDLTFILSNNQHMHYGQIKNIKNDSISITCNLNAKDELSFDVYKILDESIDPLWDETLDFKLVFVKELNEYFKIKVSVSDSSNGQIKTVTGTSLCEEELSQLYLYNLEINTEEDIIYDDYDTNFPVIFYRDIDAIYLPEYVAIWNSDPYKYTVYDDNEQIDVSGTEIKRKAILKRASLMHQVLDKAVNYSIGYIDETLKSLQRTFSIDGTTIYDFLTGECSEEFHCIFQFDSVNRSISAYDLYTSCNECGYRSDDVDFYDKTYNHICPKCGASNIKYFGEDTTIYVDKDNLTDEITFDTDTDSVKNVFKLEAGDDQMTSIVQGLNPNGSSYIIYVADWMKEDMPDELVNLLDDYNVLYESRQEEYTALLQAEYEAMNQVSYYMSSMMPTAETSIINATTEANKLTEENLSPISLSSLSKYTVQSSVETAIKNYAKVYAKTGYVKVEINDNATYFYNDSTNTGVWKGMFTVTNYSDDEDVVVTDYVTIEVNDDYETFLLQKLAKAFTSNDEEDNYWDVLGTDSIDVFKQKIQQYSLNRLESFHDAIESAMTVLMQAGQAEKDSSLYQELYVPYTEKLLACEDEMELRNQEIEKWNTIVQEKNYARSIIQKELDFESYLNKDIETTGIDYYKLFNSYRREDKYTNSNYTYTDDMTDAEAIELAQVFLKQARQELVKSATAQHSISSSLYNLLLIPAFQPLIDNFQLGNWLRIRCDEKVYRLRLIQYTINFGDLTNIDVEFSDVTNVTGIVSDMEQLINSVQSISGSFDYVATQADKGDSGNQKINNILQNGLNSALVQIANNNSEEITISKQGLLAKAWNDELGEYDPEQFIITHNILAYTDDGFKSVKAALGKHQYTYYNSGTGNFVNALDYGLSATFVQAGYIYGSQIISGDIISENYSPTSGTYLNLRDGSFTFAGGKLVYDSSLNKMTLRGVTIEWDSTTSPEISDINGLEKQLSGIQADLDQLDGRIETYSQINDPSAEWSTTTDKQNHIGDLWYNPDTSITQRWNGTVWEKTTDSDLSILAQSKAQIFTTPPTIPPTTPYYEGDLWVQGSNGDILNCTTTKTSGNYSASDWVKSSKYTDDSATKALDEKIAQILAGEYKTTIGEDYVISPHIAGGYLNITDSSHGSVIIDPSNTQNSNYIFGVYNPSSSLVIGVDTNGNALFKGELIATGGKIGGFNIESNSLKYNAVSFDLEEGKIMVPQEAGVITFNTYFGDDSIRLSNMPAIQLDYYPNDGAGVSDSSIPAFRLFYDGSLQSYGTTYGTVLISNGRVRSQSATTHQFSILGSGCVTCVGGAEKRSSMSYDQITVNGNELEIASNNNYNLRVYGTANISTIYEGGITLSDKYSKKIVAADYSTSISIDAGSYHVDYIDISKSGYTPIAVGGFTIAGTQSSNTAMSICRLYSTTQVQYQVNSWSTSTATLTITIRVLYIKD